MAGHLKVGVFLGVAGLALGLAGPSLAAECDSRRGAAVFAKCAPCHTHVAGNMSKSGPNLHGLFGREAASAEFKAGYSPAMAAAGVVWNAETLDQFLKSPRAFVPRNRMLFIGLRDDGDRNDLICYLEQATR